MNKIFTILAILLVSASCLTNKQILQQGLNGAFESNQLPHPTTIIPCIDQATAGKIVAFIGSALAKAAKGSVSDLIALITQVKNFGDQIPQTVKDCLDGNKQFQALGLKYGIDNNTDSSVIEKKIAVYITLHYSEFHKEMGVLNDLWIALKYFNTGSEGATYGHKVLKISNKVILPELTNKQILQQTLNGLFEQNKLPDPTTIVPCIDEATAGKIVAFIGDVLRKASGGSPTQLISLIDQIKKFGDQIPQSVKDCLDGNKQFQALGLKYGIDNNTDTSAIEKKVIEYITLHYLTVHKWLGDLNTEWKGAKYYQTGFDAAKYGHNVLGLSSKVILPELTNKQIILQTIYQIRRIVGNI